MDSDSQTDKPPQGDFQGFTNILGTFIAFITLITPLAAIVFFSPPLTVGDSVSERPAQARQSLYLG